MNPTIRPLTRADILKFHPDGIADTTRGFAIEKDGRVLGIGGVIYTRPAMQAFSSITPEARKFPVTLMKAARKVAALLETIDAPVFAIADEQYNTSEQFLERIGFSRFRGRMYIWT